jgi:hypothetical protein
MYYGSGLNGDAFQNHVVYLGDTTVNEYSDVHVLQTERRYDWSWPISPDLSRSYARQSNDSIFQLIDGVFEFMFDFNVQAGDTKVVYIGGDLCSQHDTMLIEATGTMYYQGQQLRTYDYRILVEDQYSQIEGGGYAGVRQGRYVERIGLLVDHPINNRFYCEGLLISEYMPANFDCYTDSELAVNFPDTCNLFLALQNEKGEIRPELTFLNQSLKIQNAPNSTLHIYDILGKELLQTAIQRDNEVIDLSHLPNGILMVVCESDKIRFTTKFVKSDS